MNDDKPDLVPEAKQWRCHPKKSKGEAGRQNIKKQRFK
jgi:hypothetical protein